MSTPPISLIVGDEPLLVREAEEAAIAAAFDGRPNRFNIAEFSADERWSEALGMAKTQPMMSKRRVVILRAMDKAPVELLDALLVYAENPNPTTALVLTGPKLPAPVGGQDRGKRLENRLKKTPGAVHRFRAKDQDPISFAVERAQAAGCSLDRRAASLLVELVGADLSRLQSEVDKMVAYVGGSGRIGGEVIEEVCSLVAEAVIWDLTDAVVARDPDRGLAAAHRLLEDGEASHKLLVMVTWQVRQLLELQGSLLSGEPEPSSWSRMPYSKRAAASAALRRRPLPAERSRTRTGR